MKDELLKISLLDGQARALLARTTDVVEDARKIHNLSRVATAALGRLLTATALIASTLKSKDDSVTCVIKGSGPIGTLMAVGNEFCRVKGYAQNPNVDLERVRGKLPVGDAVGHEGTLTVIKDLGLRQPYSGQVALVSGEIAEDFCQYFMCSEQTPSIVSLGVLVGDDVKSSGGIIVQAMPGASDEAIRELELSSALFANISGVVADCGTDEMIKLMLGHLNPKVLESVAPAYSCDCRRERVERALVSLGKSELEEMISSMEAEGGEEKIDVDCQFCDKRYSFKADDLKTLLEQAVSKN